MKEFVPPEIDTKDTLGEIGLDYAFQIRVRYEERHETATPRGSRLYRAIVGGQVSGPRMQGEVYPQGGGEYDLRRGDGVEDVNAHIMLRASGEWIYVRHQGYERADGYYRVAAYFDADLRGRYAWMNNAVFLATAEPSEDGDEVVFTYYEAT